MKLIFLRDVPNVAGAGEIKEVADGYGRNFLIPQKLAMRATPLAIKTMETQRRSIEHSQAQTEAEMKELAHQLEEKEIILKARSGASDRLFGSITSADIVSELQNTIGLVLDKKKLELPEPIRHLGSYQIVIKLAKDISPTIKVTIEKEETV
jgi:large subunit ribosomal protein L9